MIRIYGSYNDLRETRLFFFESVRPNRIMTQGSLETRFGPAAESACQKKTKEDAGPHFLNQKY